MKKIVLLIFVFLLFLEAKDENTIVVAGPIATVSHPLFYMIQNDVLKDINKKIEFRLWNNPDELRALVLKGDVDFIALPTNVAANLYNKGVDLKLLNVSIWGILQMISRDETIKNIENFKGKKIVVPFRADMPDIVLQALVKKAGLDLKKDFEIQYVASPVDAMQMLILRRADNALLAEPAVSIALRKSGSYPLKLVAPELYRSVNLQSEWGRLLETTPKIPQAGIAFVGDTKNKEALINRFMNEYEKAIVWYKQNKQEASKLAVKNLPMLDENGLADSIDHVVFESVKAQDSKKDLDFFFEVLKENNAKLIGGRLPENGFYFK